MFRRLYDAADFEPGGKHDPSRDRILPPWEWEVYVWKWGIAISFQCKNGGRWWSRLWPLRDR